MKKTVITMLCLLLAMVMVLSGCGSESAGDSVKPAKALKKGEALELTGWSMNATAWSSPNGATVNLTAIPNGYAEGQSALFTVRLEGEQIASVPCNWDGSVYTASADLNGADGYCYYVVLTAADGTQTEVAVNTPTAPTDESLINMAEALNAYCEAYVEESSLEDGKVTITKGSAKIRLPWLTLDEGTVSCQDAALTLSYNGEICERVQLAPGQAGEDNTCVIDLAGIGFAIPENIEDDHQLSIQLEVTLSNGHSLTAPAGIWYYLDGQLLLAVG